MGILPCTLATKLTKLNVPRGLSALMGNMPMPLIKNILLPTLPFPAFTSYTDLRPKKPTARSNFDRAAIFG